MNEPGYELEELGNLTVESNERLGNRDGPVMSSTKHFGLVRSDEYFKGRQIFSSNLSNYKAARRGQIVYATNHLAEGSIGLQDRYPLAAVSPIYTVVTCLSHVLPEYLIRVLKSEHLMREYARREQASVERRGAIRYRDFSTIRIPLPNLWRQQRVDAILSELDSQIRSTEAIIDKLRRARGGLIGDLLNNGVGGTIRGRPSSDEVEGQPETAPVGWDVVRCSEICTDITVGIVVRPSQYYRQSGIPMLRSANVRPDGLNLTDLVYMSARDHLSMHKSAVAPGDLVTVRTGNPGTTSVVSEDLPTANCVDIIVSRPGSRILPAYLALWLNSEFGKGQVLRGQGGLAQQHFNVSEMKSLRVAVPSLIEQGRIVDAVAQFDAQVSAEVDQMSKLNSLKQGLLVDLLTGCILIPEEHA